MNKRDMIEKIKEKTGLNDEQCNKINDVLDNHFIIGKNNKEKIVSDIAQKLNIDEEKADDIYNKVMSIIGSGIKDKLKNPFKSNDLLLFFLWNNNDRIRM